MFVIGVGMIVLGVAMAAFGILGPSAALVGLVIGGLGVGLSGLLLAYLDAPSRRDKPPPGTVRAKATILDAGGTAGAVAGYQMVELTLEVRPKDGLPFQVKRKVSTGRVGRIEQGRTIDVLYDPANPQKLELA